MNIPHNLLPIEEPRYHQETPEYFYRNVVKPLLGDVLRIQENGIPIDMLKVEDLKKELEVILADVHERLRNNTLVKRFQLHKEGIIKDTYKSEQLGKVKSPMHYFKPFSNKNISHRAYLVNRVLINLGRASDCKPGWAIKDIKKDEQLMSQYSIQRLLTKNVPLIDQNAVDAMMDLAVVKRDKEQEKYTEKSAKPPDKLFKEFSPASAPQKQALFEFLNIPSEAVSKKTGLPKWDKEQVQRVNKTYTDPDVIALTDAIIDYSQAAIIRQNFINAFDNYVIDGVLYGNFKLFGAKS